jgi:hypothetical protein
LSEQVHWAILCEVAQLPACGARGFDPEGHGRDTLFVVRQAAPCASRITTAADIHLRWMRPSLRDFYATLARP